MKTIVQCELAQAALHIHRKEENETK
jgi:hypothetical protein